eukprot:2363368-Pyramimonas_sp.AAC.1
MEVNLVTSPLRHIITVGDEFTIMWDSRSGASQGSKGTIAAPVPQVESSATTMSGPSGIAIPTTCPRPTSWSTLSIRA